GCAWAVPYLLPFSNVFKEGINTIRIEVTNLPANRIAQLDREKKPWRKMNEINVVDINYQKTTYEQWALVPSGLNSRVILYRVK
ncbi:MAG: glycosyl hydrolase family 2, partial [Prevotella sp.]|nr:glycosyl hydrolase family 2 [Prevotella sp.]